MLPRVTSAPSTAVGTAPKGDDTEAIRRHIEQAIAGARAISIDAPPPNVERYRHVDIPPRMDPGFAKQLGERWTAYVVKGDVYLKITRSNPQQGLGPGPFWSKTGPLQPQTQPKPLPKEVVEAAVRDSIARARSVAIAQPPPGIKSSPSFRIIPLNTTPEQVKKLGENWNAYVHQGRIYLEITRSKPTPSMPAGPFWSDVGPAPQRSGG
jgi:hypothetical protein